MTKKAPPTTDQKSEFLLEMAEGYAKWKAKGNEEYAALYEYLMCAVTQPKTEIKK